MKLNSINPFMYAVTAAKSRLCKTVFLSVAIAAIGSATAYAKVENCPGSETIRFDKDAYQWKTTERGWKSYSSPRNVADLGGVTLKSVILKINHKEGDVVGCVYDADNGEKVVFAKGGSAEDSSGSIIRAEIIPVGEGWDNVAAKDEFICQPSSTNECAFDEVVSLPDVSSGQPGQDARTPSVAALPPQVKLHFVPGTAFAAYACAKTDLSGITCSGPFYVNGTYYLPLNTDRFCVEVNRFAGRSWGQYYFRVDENYAGDEMNWWGASVDPQYSLPTGIRFVTHNESVNYSGCGLLDLNS